MTNFNPYILYMVNKVILIGNVGADPDVKYLEGGVAVARFSLATSEVYNNKNGERVNSNRMAQYRSLAKSGSNSREIRSQGDDALHRGTHQNPFLGRPERGKKIHDRDLRDNFQMLSRKQDNRDKPQDTHMPQAPDLSGGDDSDDLPF